MDIKYSTIAPVAANKHGVSKLKGLPLISFMFIALSAFPAPDIFLNRTNPKPRIFPSIKNQWWWMKKIMNVDEIAQEIKKVHVSALKCVAYLTYMYIVVRTFY